MIRVWNRLQNIFLGLDIESGQKSVKAFVTLEAPVWWSLDGAVNERTDQNTFNEL